MTVRVLGILTALLFLVVPKAAVAQTTADAAVVLITGTHSETRDSFTGSAPALVVRIRHRQGRADVELEGVPTLHAQLQPANEGLTSVRLSYLGGAVRYWVDRRIALGAGETVYNQQSEYLDVLATASGGGIIRDSHVDRSRVAGARYDVLLRPSPSSPIEMRISVDPHLHGAIGSQFTQQNPGSATFVSPWSAIGEHGSQADAEVSARHELHHGRLTYGVRYLNLVMRYPNEVLADRNTFVMPFVAWGTNLGR